MRSRFLGLIAIVGAAASPAGAASIFSIDANSNLVVFDSSTPGTTIQTIAVSGLGTASLLGIDFSSRNGALYGVATDNVLYTINTVSGLASAVGAAFAPPLTGQSFGFDFNPTIDRIRVVSNADNNYVLNPDTGQQVLTPTPPVNVAYGAGDPNQGANAQIVSVAYTPSFFGAPGTSTQLYALDENLNLLTKQANSAGTLTTVGSLGFNLSATGGFDIGPDGLAYILDNNRFYTLDLTTGATSLVGNTSTSRFGIAIANAVPEPASWAMMITGFGLVGGAMRRRPSRVSFAA